MSPANITFEHIEKPTESLAEEATQVFAGLMVEDPAAIALVGGDMSLLPSLGACMIRALALTPGVGDVFTARNENGELVGYAIFSLPGQLILSTPEQQKHGLFDFMGKLSPEGQKYYPEVMAKEVPKANDEAFGIQEAERNTYWCNFAMAAKAGATMALTTTNIRNVPIYEKLGFKLYGHKVMPSPWVDWPLWFFAKETQAKAE
ncbi:hypothetical protein OH77DRAFT_1521688 [Trametes cingulata]|nr:hypothetical protein OH77DRAFT_1521688 [Trametes cingulata]